MSTTKESITAEQSKQLTSMAKQSTPKKAPQPFDPARQVGMDPRDPRSRASQWPCYGVHTPDKSKSNQHGQWSECAVCALRLSYVPRVGSHAMTTKASNPAMVDRMLRATFTATEGRRPTMELCKAMQAKIDADEVLESLVREVNGTPKPKNVMFQDLSKMNPPGSPTASWDAISEDPSPAEIEALLSEDEKVKLKQLLQERRGQAQSSSAPPYPRPMEEHEMN